MKLRRKRKNIFKHLASKSKLSNTKRLTFKIFIYSVVLNLWRFRYKFTIFFLPIDMHYVISCLLDFLPFVFNRKHSFCFAQISYCFLNQNVLPWKFSPFSKTKMQYLENNFEHNIPISISVKITLEYNIT